MTRETSTNLDDILNWAVARLVSEVDLATVDNTYVSTVSQELPPSPDEVMFEVSIGPNLNFDGGIIVGAGQASIHTRGQLMVTIHITQSKDEAGRDLHYMNHETLGVSPLVKGVLKAIAATDPVDVNDASEHLLAEYIIPVSVTIPPKDEREKGYVTCFFDISFDWDMT